MLRDRGVVVKDLKETVGPAKELYVRGCVADSVWCYQHRRNDLLLQKTLSTNLSLECYVAKMLSAYLSKKSKIKSLLRVPTPSLHSLLEIKF